MTKYIVKDKAFSHPCYWNICGMKTNNKDKAYIFTADELKNGKLYSEFLLNKKRYVLIPVKETGA